MEHSGKKNTVIIIVGILIALVTFPINDWSFGAGIDPPLKWVFSHFYETGFNNAQYLTFPHGPLAFLMYPLSNTIVITTIFTLFLKITLFYLVLELQKEKSWKQWVQAIISVYLISVLAGFNQLLIAVILCSYFLYFNESKRFYKIFAFLLTAIALYVKSYVAILTGLFGVSFIIYELYQNRNWKQFIIDGATLFGLMYLIWLFIFESFSGFLDYLYGITQLAQDNSSAAAYYPENNWFYLIIFLITVITIPLITKTKKSFYFSILLIPAFFGAWKHGMAREDIFHVNGLFVFVVIVYLLYLSFEYSKRLRTIVFVGLGLYLFSLNTVNSINYTEAKYSWFGLDNFYSYAFNYSKTNNTLQKETTELLNTNRLPEDIRKEIGTATVDIYPWDYSIAAVNHLNWKPRPVLHSYASYTHWLDQKNANHFKSDAAPEYIIWERNKISTDLNEGIYNSIDNRYLLNDEPQTFIELLKNYESISKTDKFLILKKRKQKLNVYSNISPDQKVKFNKWIPVPGDSESHLRVKVDFTPATSQKMKSFFYKDEQYWILLKLKTGEIHKYRFVPKNAVDGLWIAPYLYDDYITSNQQVKEIQFISSGSVNNEITINWEVVSFKDKTHVLDFFQAKKTKKTANQILYRNKSLEKLPKELRARKHQYSKPFILSCDSLPEGETNLSVQFKINTLNVNPKNLKLVISVEGEQNIWKGIPISPQIINHGNESIITGHLTYDNIHNSDLIKVYVINDESSIYQMSRFEIIITNGHSLNLHN